MSVSLHVVYEGQGGRPLTAAKVYDRDLIRLAARKAVEEAIEDGRQGSPGDRGYYPARTRLDHCCPKSP